MNESTDQKPELAPADTAKPVDACSPALAALPLVESPSIDPDVAPAESLVAKVDANKPAEPKVAETLLPEAKPADEAVKAEDAKPVAKGDGATVEANGDTKPVPPFIPLTPASKRFREQATAQIVAARERITQRNLSGAMTMALAIGVLSAGVAGGTGYLAGLSERSTTHAIALEQSVLRIEAEMLALRSEIERAARTNNASASETGQRLERIEKAQAEPLAKLSKLAEMVEKLRNVQASTLAASKIDASDVTGSVSPQQSGKGRNATAVVEAWVLREFDKDVALIEGKRGLLEIAVGDDIPGLGRVEGFRKHDGRWAVVTSKGLIVSR